MISKLVRGAGLVAALALFAAPVHATGCKAWSTPEQIGTLNAKIIDEASGIAISKQFPNRLYHNNDSGDGPNFYITDMKGADTQTVSVTGFTPQDVEDIALGKCGRHTCLYLGDIGDNLSQRKTVTIVLVRERKTYPASVAPVRVVTARYPDFPHNAESLAVDADGNVFVITKPMDWSQRRAGVAQVFELTAKQIRAGGSEPQVFTEVADIDMPYLLFQWGALGRIATALDIAPDGKSFLVLTYQVAMEVEHPLGKDLPPSHAWVPGKDYRVTPIAKLPQAEAIAYTPDGKSFLYTTESQGKPTVPIERQTCTER